MADTSKHRQPPVRRMHHYAWGVVCLLLVLTMGGLWIHAQSLDVKVKSLEKQLIASQQAVPSTCRIDTSWKASSTTALKTSNGRLVDIHLPAEFKNSDYYPLVLFYPGKGSSAKDGQTYFGLDSLPAIVAYPHPTLGTDGYYAWQGAPYSSPANDVAFTSEVIDELQSELCIDRTRIYAIGMSNGGGFVSLLSCRLSDTIAAFAIVAGAMYSPAGDCKPSRPVSLITIHGDDDQAVPYAGSLTRKLPAIDSWAKRRADLNGCKTPQTTKDGLRIVVTTWADCRDDTVTQSIRVIGGRHGWGDITNARLWQFLSQSSL
jgi:polyhydroxybutyrate depolymerase